MERMWRKVNQGLSSRSSKASAAAEAANLAGFGEVQNVVAVSGAGGGGGGSFDASGGVISSSNFNVGTNTLTGKRLATSGQTAQSTQPMSFSQHAISTASSERRRRRRRKSRPKKNGDRNESGPRNDSSHNIPPAIVSSPISALTGSKRESEGGNRMPPLPPLPTQRDVSSGAGAGGAGGGGGGSSGGDPTLKQRAVAKLRLFNFHLNWDLHMTQCKPCGPRSSGNILTRRLCRNRRRREDNELYRSNSFKFERFERRDGNDGGETLKKQISVCDDYSLPIDFVKKRPSSFDPCLADTLPDNWAAPSPLSEHVSFLDPPTIVSHSRQAPIKLVEGYSDPKDSRKFLRPHRKNRKDKLSNYSSDSSAPKSSAEDDNLSNKAPELNSPDSISEDLVRPLQPYKSPKRLPVPDISKRNPSPYYYSDLLKAKEAEPKESNLRPRQSTASEPPHSTAIDINLPSYKKSVSLDVPDIEREVPKPKRYSITEEGVRIIRCNTPSTTTSEDSDCSECQKRREWHARALALVRETCNITAEQPSSSAIVLDSSNHQVADNNCLDTSSMPPHRLLGPAVCACTAPTTIGDDADEFFRPRSIFYVHQQGAHECADCSTTNLGEGSDKSTNTDLPEDDMSGSRTRQIYETAFDCKIARSDDDLDDMDRLTNHSVLMQINNGNEITEKPPIPLTAGGNLERSKSSKSRLELKRMKNSKNQAIQDSSGSITALSNNLESVRIDHINNMNNANTTSSSQLPIRGYTPSPPSTAPLPVKFPGKHDRFLMNSIKSAPNLPASNPAHPRLKDLRLPIDSAMRRQDTAPTGSDGSMLEVSYDPPPRNSHHGRPRSVVLESGRVLELRKSSHRNRHQPHQQQQRGRNYSSTESMATSSSGGSMESLRSSTSEGNRSTTSSESRQSTSLSSHSSDSGHNVSLPLRATVLLHSKLHILSPISDKSSQEPGSETSELNHHNRSNHSQKTSPVDDGQNQKISTGQNRPIDCQLASDSITKQPKRRTLPNKALLHLTDEIIGSDSGISLHSREEGKSNQSALDKFVLPKLNIPSDKMDSNSHQSSSGGGGDGGGAGSGIGSGTGLPQDLRDLPFDMPKLRRRKILSQQDGCTSGSATSVDLGDLPFDMPKLRRRLRMNQPQIANLIVHSTESSGISQASSSHSVRDDQKPLVLDTAIFRQNLTLNLNEAKPETRFGSLDLKGASMRGLNLNLGKSAFAAVVDLIDASIPLDRQGWYHGAITRIEAENTLRPLTEGSFLVRNCESTKQDYSLSLKSAKGFMHMRIQRNDSGQYILGQFSRPFDSIPEMIRHFCLNRLPVRGAEHMCLLDPVIAQLL